MQITSQTKYSEFAPHEKYVTEKTVAEIKKAAEVEFGAMYDLTFEAFHACANGEFSGALGDLSDPTVLQVYWMKRFAEFVEEFTKTLNGLTLPQKPDEAKAAQGLLKVSWDEGLLIFLQSFFGLRSFKEAEQITIGEIVIAKRAQYNRDKFARNMADIQTAKFKKK